jgi:low temperature requirement protein LtrA
MPLHVRMSPRDPEETHRASTPLELFFDLTFVVAIAQAAASLHHGLVEGDTGDALITFPLAFFAIWWAWMNFSWFASAYDTDDALYRVMVFVQVAGVLILAAGIPRAFEDQDFGAVTAGYVVMRLGMVAMWLRAAACDVAGRRTAQRYALGIAVVEVFWVLRLALPDSLSILGFLVLVGAELAVPVWAESTSRTPWHPRHIAERYALFTIIVLGESLLAATMGVQAALDSDSSFGDLAAVVVGGVLLVCSMWWLYFDMPAAQAIERARRAFDERLTGAFAWGYGHYFVFAAAAATGAGLAVAVDQATHHSELEDWQAGLALTVPASVFVAAVALIHFRQKAPSRVRNWCVPVTVPLLLVSSFTPEPVLAAGLTLAGLVAVAAYSYRDGFSFPTQHATADRAGESLDASDGVSEGEPAPG